MKSWSDPAVFAPAAGAPRTAVAPVAWAPVRLEESGVPAAVLDPAEELELQHTREVETASQEGFAAGAAQARAEAEASLRSALAAAADAAAQLREAEATRLASIQADLGALAIGIARCLLGREVKDGQVVAELVRRALAEFPPGQPLRVRINPHDLSTLSAVKGPDGGAVAIAAGQELTWAPDPQLERGGVVVEGRDRIVDGRVELALERIYRRLADG